MPYRRTTTRRPRAATSYYGARTLTTSTYDSWGDYVSTAELPETTHADGSPLGRSSREHDRPEWMGTRTFEDAAKLARDGWADGAARLSELTARLEGRLANVSSVKRITNSMVGPGVLDIGRYLMGHPEPYMVWAESDELTDVNPDRIVKLVVCCGANANLSTQQIWWRGAAACVIADLIESTGARVEIELGRKSRNGNATHLRRVLVKRAQDTVAPEILAFALAHNASHRRIDWGVRETLPVSVRQAMGSHRHASYGTSVDLDTDDIGGALYIPYSDPAFSEPESTAAWIVKTLSEYGIEVIGDE